MIRVLVAFTALCFAGLFVQASLIHATAPAAVAPDITLVLVVITALNFRSSYALVGVFVLGLLVDFASGIYLGPSAAAYIVVFHTVGAIASRVYADRGFAVALMTFVCSIVKSLIYISFLLIYVDSAFQDLFKVDTAKLIGTEALLSAVFAPLIVKILTISRQMPQPGRVSSVSSSSSFWD